MKKALLVSLLWLFACVSLQAQEPAETASKLFHEFSTESVLHADLWGRDLCGPVLLIDPQTKQVWANVPDAEGALTRLGDIYTGQYPLDRPIANTAVTWSGVEWAMILLPALTSLEDKADRVSLMAHESFHVVQPLLGFSLSGSDNLHLDRMEARIAMKLELEAVKKALAATDDQKRKGHLTDAFLFRAYRRSLFPGADRTENDLEIAEGLAEYTGEATSGRAEQDKLAHFNAAIDGFYHVPSFVRSFSYQTIPAYGWMLDGSRPGWNREIDATTDLTAFFTQAFGLTIPEATQEQVARRAVEYGGEAITAGEIKREEERVRRMAAYREAFVTKPHLDITLEAMQISFDPRNVLVLEGEGTVYPSLYVKDNWGVLEVSDGALMSPDQGMAA